MRRSLLLMLILPLAACVVDADGDGYTNDVDCDDSDPEIHPDAPEYCDGVDTNCDGLPDGPQARDARSWFYDGDMDGYGSDRLAKACEDPVGYVDNALDCDDEDPDVNPEATEIPGNGVDDDCDPSTPD